MEKPLVIGVAGGSGSGKTTVSRAILAAVGERNVAMLPHDLYYRDYSHLPLTERAKINYDHPDALENDLLVAHIRALSDGQPIDRPRYDYAQYIRLPEVDHVAPGPVILVEGILIFADPLLRDQFAVKVFVDADADLRFIRRLQRDIRERQRDPEQVIAQYLKTVRPMYLDFVEPSKRYADVIIPRGGHNRVAIEMVVARVLAALSSDGP